MPVISPVLAYVAKAFGTPLARRRSFRYAGRPPIRSPRSSRKNRRRSARPQSLDRHRSSHSPGRGSTAPAKVSSLALAGTSCRLAQSTPMRSNHRGGQDGRFGRPRSSRRCWPLSHSRRSHRRPVSVPRGRSTSAHPSEKPRCPDNRRRHGRRRTHLTPGWIFLVPSCRDRSCRSMPSTGMHGPARSHRSQFRQ